MATAKVANRYPRQGERIAPLTLYDFLADPLPKRLQALLGGADLRLCDLDESVWQRFSRDQIKQLAKAVVAYVSIGRVQTALRRCRLPRLLPHLRWDELPLEHRTRRCLKYEGFDVKPSRLGDHTLGDLLAIRSFGPRCLLDLLTAVEALQKKSPVRKRAAPAQTKCSAELTAEAEKVLTLKDSRLMRCDDPRVGPLMQTIDSEAATVYELAHQLRSRRCDPPDTAYVLQKLHQLRLVLERMADLSLEDELIQLFATTRSARNREILIGYYGWTDGQTHTLTEIGNRFGITRERVRQICAKLTRKRRETGTILAPVMDSVLALIEKCLPLAADKIEAELLEKGFTTVGLSLEAVAAGAKLLNRPVRFKVMQVDEGRAFTTRRAKTKAKPPALAAELWAKHKGYLAVHADQASAVAIITDQAKKEVYFHGLSRVARVERILARRYHGPLDAQLVRQTLLLIDGFRWLDEPSGWFTIQGIAKHGLPKAIDKVLAVAGEVAVSELRMALARNRRLWREPPPEKVLLQYCGLMPNVCIGDKHIRSVPPRNWKKVLTGVEGKLVSVLKKYGPLMDRGSMEELCVGAGMNRFSFHAFVSWSPVIVQYAPSIYGLLGARITQEQIERLTAARRANRSSQRVLSDHGVNEDGMIWLKYRLSKAASTYAVITIPADLKKIIRGRFQLLDPHGRVIGALAAKDGRAWGLGAYLRACDAKLGDQVTLTIDLAQRSAAVIWEKQN